MTTRTDAYQTVTDTDEDVSLRRQVATVVELHGPLTTQEIAQQFPERSLNAIRPRVNELVRMGCVERKGRKENPSGHEAYLHHLTDTGREYVAGHINPDPEPPIAELQRMVVKAARDYINGEIDPFILRTTVERHDRVKRQMDPDKHDN